MIKDLKIQVLGSGCPTCKKMYELTQAVVNELDLGVEVEYITDIQKIVEMGVMSSPVLAINDQVVLSGYLPSAEEIKEKLNGFVAVEKTEDACCSDDENQKSGGCSCGGSC